MRKYGGDAAKFTKAQVTEMLLEKARIRNEAVWLQRLAWVCLAACLYVGSTTEVHGWTVNRD